MKISKKKKTVNEARYIRTNTQDYTQLISASDTVQTFSFDIDDDYFVKSFYDDYMDKEISSNITLTDIIM